MKLTRRTALVTGANKGIGFETARQLARQGFMVWLGARDEARGKAAAAALAGEGDVRFAQLDVTDDASVQAAAARLEQETGALDVLVNNAGIYLAEGDGSFSTADLDALHRTLEVNVYGALRVTRAFLPLVKGAPAGRIVMVSSSVGSFGRLTQPGNGVTSHPYFAYSTSKTALNALTVWLAAELADTKIRVSAVCPGYTATDLNGHAGTQPAPVAAEVVVRAATLGADGPHHLFVDAAGAVPW